MKCMHARRLRLILALGISVLAIPAFADDPVGYRIVDTQPSASDYQTTPAQGDNQVVSAPAVLVQPAAHQQCACSQSCNCASEKKEKELAAAMKGAYKGLFYGNDFAYLNSPLYDGPYFPGDPLKGLADGKLDLGGEFRSRFHHEHNHRGLGLTGRDDEFWLTRLRLFANYRVNDYVRFYGEYLYADSAGENFAPRPIEENRGEAQNLFFDVKLTDNLTVRGGRQELLLGNQRLISPLDWANTRRTFDGVRGTYKGDSWTVDGFYTNPVRRVAATAGTLEWDNTNDDAHFFGGYATKMGACGGANLDAYYLAFDNETTNFSYHMLGNRLWGTGDNFNYELEGGFQFGQNVDGSDHSAGFFTAGLGRQMDIASWKPTVWLWYDWASGGDQPFNPGDDGFHHYFPLAHKYLGFMDLFGRRNINDVNVQFITPVHEKVKLLVWYHYFFLDKQTTPFGVTMAPFNTAAAAGSKDLGSEIDIAATVSINPRNSVVLGYSFFDAGNYYQTTAGVPTSADADFFFAQFQSRF